MTAIRFRVKYAPDPTSHWRDFVVGEDELIDEFQTAVNEAFGLGSGHRWFIGEGEKYWNSRIKYLNARDVDENHVHARAFGAEQVANASDVTIGEMVRSMGLERYDRICYLYDDGEEWRFHAILKEFRRNEPSDSRPEPVESKGPAIGHHSEAGVTRSADRSVLPDPLPSALPETAVPVAALRELETREDVVHVIPVLTLETGYGPVCERFLIQFHDSGYILENFQPGWQIVEAIEGNETTEEELLAALADEARAWHEEIAEISSAMTGRQFAEETIEAMHDELNAELERKGYGHL